MYHITKRNAKLNNERKERAVEMSCLERLGFGKVTENIQMVSELFFLEGWGSGGKQWKIYGDLGEVIEDFSK